MSTRQGARFGLPGSGGRADAVDGAPDSPDEFADAEQGLAGSPAAPTMGAFAAAAALHSPAPPASLRAGSAPPGAVAPGGLGGPGRVGPAGGFAGDGVREPVQRLGQPVAPGQYAGGAPGPHAAPRMGAFGAAGYQGAGSPSPFDAGRGALPGAPPGAPGRGAPHGRVGRGGGPRPAEGGYPGFGRGGPMAGGPGLDHGGDLDAFDHGVGPGGGQLHPAAELQPWDFAQFERGLQDLIRLQYAAMLQGRQEQAGAPFWRTSGAPPPARRFSAAPGPGGTYGKLVQTVELATETMSASNLLVPRAQAEAQAEAHFNGVFEDTALRMWQDTKMAAGMSTTFVGHGSRLYRRLSAMLRTYAPHDPRGEWTKLRRQFRWQSSLSETERVFNELVAEWTELARQSEGRSMADQVPYPDELWLWEVLSQAPGVPAWVLEKSKTQQADFRQLGVFAALRKHSAGLTHTGAASTMGMPRVHALSMEANAPDGPWAGLSMSALAAAAADMGFGLAPLPREDTPTGAALAAAAADMGFGLVPREGMPSGAGSSPTLRGTPLCAMVDTDGVLRATNNLPIECHICAENHFKSDCPKLDTTPCFHCRGDHALRVCPTAPPGWRPRPRSSTSAPTRYVRPGLGLSGKTFVSGPGVHMLAGARPPSHMSSAGMWAPDATRGGAHAFPMGVPSPPGAFEPATGPEAVDWAYVRDLERYVQRREDQDREAAAAESACAEEPAAAPTPALGVQWTHGARFTELDAAKPGNV